MVKKPLMLKQLQLHEGIELQLYPDTEGNDTLGIGYNVAARTLEEFNRTIGRKIDVAAKPCITHDEAVQQCLADITRVERAVVVHFPEYQLLNEVRQRVCVDLAFNIGFKALGFKKCIAAIKINDWSWAARELIKSHWSTQVQPGVKASLTNTKIQGRADRLSRMLLTGADYVS